MTPLQVTGPVYLSAFFSSVLCRPPADVLLSSIASCSIPAFFPSSVYPKDLHIPLRFFFFDYIPRGESVRLLLYTEDAALSIRLRPRSLTPALHVRLTPICIVSTKSFITSPPTAPWVFFCCFLGGVSN